jgi:hypothetical protein
MFYAAGFSEAGRVFFCARRKTIRDRFAAATSAFVPIWCHIRESCTL